MERGASGSDPTSPQGNRGSFCKGGNVFKAE